jgi:hypothetical protein
VRTSRASPDTPPARGASPATGARAPKVSHSLRPVDSVRARLRESAPLFLIGAAFFAGVWVASADHVRVLTSPYPLWILLAINGAVALVAASTSVFVPNPDSAIDDDPDIVRVRRDQWEALVRDLNVPHRVSGPPSWMTDRSPAWSALLPGDGPGAGGSASGSGVDLDRRSGPIAGIAATGGDDDPSSPRGKGLLELRGIAQNIVASGELLGGEELQRALDASAGDLTRVSELLGVPRGAGESSYYLLIRLLSVPSGTYRLPPDPAAAAERGRLAVRLNAMMPVAHIPGSPQIARRNLTDATDAFDAILKEIEPVGNRPEGTNASLDRSRGLGPSSESPA